jgi:steroid delta-isomerase-like uncharacterized protein
MTKDEMNALIDAHLAAEGAGDTDGCVAMYTDDIVHDVVGNPAGPLTGPDAAKGFYDYLTSNVTGTTGRVNHAWYGEDFAVIEHQWVGAVPGEFLGIPGNGKPVDFRMLHVWEFKDGKMCRENVWVDGATIAAQLTGSSTPAAS